MSASLFNDKPLLMVNRKLIGTAGFISPRIGYGHYTPWKQKNWSGRQDLTRRESATATIHLEAEQLVGTAPPEYCL